MKTMKTETGITRTDGQAVANELAKLLTGQYGLYTKKKNASLNIKGGDFYEKDKFFEFHFERLNGMIDKVAARIRLVGRYAYATLRSVFQLTHLTEVKREQIDGDGFIKELLSDRKTIIIYCRENMHQFVKDYKDYGTSNSITGVMKEHEKMAWFLRSSLN